MGLLSFMENMSTLGGALLIYYFGAESVSLGETLGRTPGGTQWSRANEFVTGRSAAEAS
jgi:hypothetical protein